MKNNEDNEIIWDKILSGEKRISDKEAKKLQKYVKKIRKENWERKIAN